MTLQDLADCDVSFQEVCDLSNFEDHRNPFYFMEILRLWRRISELKERNELEQWWRKQETQ